MIIDFACEQIASLWDRLLGAIGDAAGSVLSGMVEAVRTVCEGDPETRRRVSFSVAIIARSAKMAKADGVVTVAEVDAFRSIFDFPEEEAKNVARLYNLARQAVAGYEAYAEKLAKLCRTCESFCPVLEDIVDALFHIASADGLVPETELDFLSRIAEIFGEKTASLPVEEVAALSVSAIEKLKLDVGITAKLSNFGVTEGRFDEIVDEAMLSGNVPVNPRQPTKDDMKALLRAELV